MNLNHKMEKPLVENSIFDQIEDESLNVSLLDRDGGEGNRDAGEGNREAGEGNRDGGEGNRDGGEGNRDGGEGNVEDEGNNEPRMDDL